jgi:hypothetical protein
MAKTVILRWTNPAEVGDIDTVEIYRKTGDHTDVTDYEAFRTDAVLVKSEAVGDADTTQTYTELNVPTGNYTYGAFSKNAGGFGPGDLINSSLTVS